jgi:hypothetical protein
MTRLASLLSSIAAALGFTPVRAEPVEAPFETVVKIWQNDPAAALTPEPS